MCGAKAGGPDLAGVDVQKETIIQGSVTRDGEPVNGYVRLLDEGGEFTAEVPTSATGQFRFFAAPGTWTLRALGPGASVDRLVSPRRGAVAEVASAAWPPGAGQDPHAATPRPAPGRAFPRPSTDADQ